MLLDTSGLLCFFDADDFRYQEAVTFFSSADKLLTHNYVLAEFIPLCQSRGLIRGEALNFASDLINNISVEVVWVDETLHRAALALLRHRNDKTYSLCDAVSFLLMREHKLNEALTTDHHFEQEGFTRLLPQ
jgi:predicted nucleic acid-binding protein